GTSVTTFPYEVLDPAWMDYLRAGNVYEFPEMKIAHRGYADVTLPGGATYHGTDVVRLYDIDADSGCIRQTVTAMGFDPDATEVEIVAKKAAADDGVPVLGFVQLDLVVTASGTTAKIGLDYRP